MYAAIIDDCAEDRLNLRALLSSCHDIELVGEAADIDSARRLLAAGGIDLLFLDIEIGRESGLDLIQSLQPRTKVIITSVHREHGDRAFDLDVTDYLIKPVMEDRLQRALVRASRMQEEDPRELRRVAVHRSGSERRFIAIETIFAITAQDKYSQVHAGSIVLDDFRTLKEWETLLQADGFQRIDRSTLIHPGRILSVTPIGRGARLAFHHSSTQLEIGRVGRTRLNSILEDDKLSP